jgi:hypothetical protein
VDPTRVIAKVKTFTRNYEDIASDPEELKCSFSGMCGSMSSMSSAQRLADCSAKFRHGMPHPLRAKAGNRMVYHVPVIIFMDDVSANISKQWNKHHVVYMSNANLPREMLDKEFCIRFVTSSPHASPSELMQAVKQSIR